MCSFELRINPMKRYLLYKKWGIKIIKVSYKENKTKYLIKKHGVILIIL